MYCKLKVDTNLCRDTYMYYSETVLFYKTEGIGVMIREYVLFNVTSISLTQHSTYSEIDDMDVAVHLCSLVFYLHVNHWTVSVIYTSLFEK